MSEINDVVIIGAGPTGMAMSLDLSGKGIKSVVIDSRTKEGVMLSMPKCQTVNSRSMEHFRRLGVADEIRRRGLDSNHSLDVVYVTSLAGKEITRFRHRTANEIFDDKLVGAMDENWPTPEFSHRCAQIFFEPVLRERVRNDPNITFFEGWKLDSLKQDKHKVTCSAHKDTVKIDLQSRYLIACDGGRGFIRKSLGIGLSGLDHVTTYRSIFFRSADLQDKLKVGSAWMYRIKNALCSNCTMIEINGKDLWLLHYDNKIDKTERTVEECLRHAIGFEVEFEVIEESIWQAKSLVADRYVEKRVILCGDAAHNWIPQGGFGMNTGLEDAMNLSWKMSAILHGWSTPDILKSYEEERRGVGELVRKEAVLMYENLVDGSEHEVLRNKQYEEDTAEGEALRQAFGKDIDSRISWEFRSVGMMLGIRYNSSSAICYDKTRDGPKFKVDVYEESCLAGGRLPHVWIAPKTSIFDVLGPAFTLVVSGEQASASDVRRLRETFYSLRVPLTVVLVQRPEAAEKYKEYPLIVVRPDYYIAWSGKSAPKDTVRMVQQISCSKHKLSFF